MKTRGRLYTLRDAKALTGENINLITFLVRERQIPARRVGRAIVLDAKGLEKLKVALADYRAKPEPAAAAS